MGFANIIDGFSCFKSFYKFFNLSSSVQSPIFLLLKKFKNIGKFFIDGLRGSNTNCTKNLITNFTGKSPDFF